MKELSIKEKAKAYDEALWKAGELYQPSYSALLEEIFPELIKYNDEKVRGAIIHFISHTPTVPKGRIDKKTMLTWLEKQGSQILANPAKTCKDGQKPTDKVKPKFHEKDWSIDDYLWQITAKEQLDVLYTKIKEAGYEWDAEHKQLKKIEQKPAEWSENDENAVSVLRHIIKQSEKINSNIYTKPVKEKLFEWLDSLKDKYTWKPSDEQMNDLKIAIDSFTFEKDYLQELYENLKKLKGE